MIVPTSVKVGLAGFLKNPSEFSQEGFFMRGAKVGWVHRITGAAPVRCMLVLVFVVRDGFAIVV